ncbi:hypothetical protein PROFUN_04388 [Planoprotostelium fungivorum]|uniref:Uncharacterized protein n=1 Tax=Planoprotostelium fungivorum TaxID=1890364 RepID=A0A2P6NHU3_9EUKA|nr:hypothetical protein PROFUN_04388 [Planoprotostelium fungivorum]
MPSREVKPLEEEMKDLSLKRRHLSRKDRRSMRDAVLKIFPTPPRSRLEVVWAREMYEEEENPCLFEVDRS